MAGRSADRRGLTAVMATETIGSNERSFERQAAMARIDSPTVSKEPPAIPEPLREAAIALFAEYGYAATGIRDIARRSGMSSAAMYHYFGSKQDLLFELMHDIMVRLLAKARDALDGIEGPEARIAALVDFQIRLTADHNPAGMTVNENELRSLEDANRQLIAGLRDEYEHLWRDAIVEGVAQGVFDVPDAKLASFAAIGMCNAVPRWYAPSGSLPPGRIAEIYTQLVMNMLRGGA